MTHPLDVWLLQSGEPLPEAGGSRALRTGLLGETLAARGHRVRWWTSAFEHQRKRWIMRHGEERTLPSGPVVTAIGGIGYARNISLRRYLDHRLVASRFARMARALTPPDILVASMPCHHLAFEGARFANEHGIPYIIDVRDLWPDIFVDRVPLQIGRAVARGLLATDFARLRSQLRGATAVVATSSGYLRWGLEYAERQEREDDQVFSHAHTGASFGTSALSAETRAWIEARRTGTIVTYFGTFGASYELGLVLSVAEAFRALGRDDIAFVFAGDGEQRPVVERAARESGNVHYAGWLGEPELREVLHGTHIGLIPCRSAPNTVPNKLFEYLSASVPVISSLEGDVRTQLDNSGAGLSYQAGDAVGLRNAIQAIADDPQRRASMSLAARALYQANGDAAMTYGRYADLVEKVALTGDAARMSLQDSIVRS